MEDSPPFETDPYGTRVIPRRQPVNPAQSGRPRRLFPTQSIASASDVLRTPPLYKRIRPCRLKQIERVAQIDFLAHAQLILRLRHVMEQKLQYQRAAQPAPLDLEI